MLTTAKEVRKFSSFSAEPGRGRDGGSTGRGGHLAAGRGKGHAGASSRDEGVCIYICLSHSRFGAFILGVSKPIGPLVGGEGVGVRAWHMSFFFVSASLSRK